MNPFHLTMGRLFALYAIQPWVKTTDSKKLNYPMRPHPNSR